MKKILLTTFCCAIMMSAQFSYAIERTFNVTHEDIVTGENLTYSNPTAISSDGSIYRTGVFDKTIEGMDAVTASSYIIKTSNDGTTIWSYSITGSATVTAITPDKTGGMYVVGIFADEIAIAGKNQTTTLEGMKLDGAYTTSQSAMFIAHYDSDGSLLLANELVPEINPALVATGMYMAEDGDIYCRPSEVKIASNGDLYISTYFTGMLKNFGGSKSIVSGTQNLFDFMFLDLPATTILKLNDALEVSDFTFTAKSNDMISSSQAVHSIAFDIDSNDNLLIGFTATGEGTVTTSSENKTYNLTLDDEGYPQSYGFFFYKVAAASGAITANKVFENVTDESFVINYIRKMFVVGDNVYACGSFNNKLPITKDGEEIACAGCDDTFVSSLSCNNFDVNWSVASGYNEITDYGTTDIEEIFAAAACDGKKIYIAGYSDSKSAHALYSPVCYNVSIADGKIISGLEFEEFVFGIAVKDDSHIYTTGIKKDSQGSIRFSTFDNASSSVEGTGADKAIVSVYPNPATEGLNFSEECDVIITSIEGKTVIVANGVSSVNVASLANGIYFVSTTVNGVVSTTTIIKK